MDKNHPKTVIYIVRNEWAMDGERDIVEEAFSTYEKAKAQFEKDVQKAKTEDPLLDDENCVVGEADDSFYLYEDGNSNENYLNIYILEMEVK